MEETIFLNVGRNGDIASSGESAEMVRIPFSVGNVQHTATIFPLFAKSLFATSQMQLLS
jgi:hypothetical protein